MHVPIERDLPALALDRLILLVAGFTVFARRPFCYGTDENTGSTNGPKGKSDAAFVALKADFDEARDLLRRYGALRESDLHFSSGRSWHHHGGYPGEYQHIVETDYLSVSTGFLVALVRLQSRVRLLLQNWLEGRHSLALLWQRLIVRQGRTCGRSRCTAARA